MDKSQIRKGEIVQFLLTMNNDDFQWLSGLIKNNTRQCPTCQMKGWIKWKLADPGYTYIKRACPDCVGKNE